MLTIQIAAVVGLVIIAGLSWYAVKLLLQLKQQSAAQKVQQQQALVQKEKKNRNLVESIDTIAMAMLQGQCDYSEGTIRICVLLDHMQLEPVQNFNAAFPALHEFYEKIKDMATHKARAALPNNERMRQDMKRLTWENEAKDDIETELSTLREKLASLFTQH